MSELKTYSFPVDHGDFTSTVELFYLKSEADKVIAELKGQVNGFKNRSNLWHYNAVEEHKKFVQVDQQITELKKACNDKDDWCLHTLKENRHQKYKRCLAMARWCASRSASWCFDPTDDELHKSDFYEKWKLRWRELAEKFKEGV